MELLKEFNSLNTKNKYTKTFAREAARAVIFKDRKLLMIYLNRENEFKFPGGGIEKGESKETALIRETLEEAGYKISKIIKELGYISRIKEDKYDPDSIYTQKSYYYLCEVHNIKLETNLSASETYYQMKAVWVDIDEAIKINEIKQNIKSNPWTERELYMLRYIKKNVLNNL